MLRLGVVQMAVLEGKVEENQKKIRNIVKKYAEDDIDLLCFPELCISGYDFKQAEKSNRENVVLCQDLVQVKMRFSSS